MLAVRKVHSVNLGYLWYFSCYYAKEVLHFPPNRGLHQTRFLLEPEYFGNRFVSSFTRRCVNFESENLSEYLTLYPITVESLKQIGGKLRGNITATAAKLLLDLSSYKNCCIFNVSVAVAVVVAEVP